MTNVRSSVLTVLVVFLLLLAVPGVVAAQEVRSGGDVVVARGETVHGDLNAFAGTVVDGRGRRWRSSS